ncbi:MAG: hypothetical protein HY403_12250 [Elusimicrobia bacterium]|nr:hypothetical protein [Elusimicrobiota bacterium]
MLAASLLTLTPPPAVGSPIPAQHTRTWETLAKYVLTNGTDRVLRAPLSKNLGFESDTVTTRALRYKSDDTPDKKTRALYVISTQSKDGKLIPKEIVLGNAAIVKRNGAKYVDGFDVRINLTGKLIAAVNSEGPMGLVEQTKLASDTAETIAAYKAEELIHLRIMDLRKLSK